MKIALTIDLDFFCRELIEWDWGHSEAPDRIGIDDVIWFTRYTSPYFDIYQETDIETYADCSPKDLLHKLKKAGYNISRRTKLGAGWSHSYAFNFFRNLDFDMLVNIDAHHDTFEADSVNCGSWISKLHEIKSFDYKWVYPRWLDQKHVERTRQRQRQNQIFKFGVINLMNALKLSGNVVGLYIAQSPSWVPPHLNDYIDDLVNSSLLISTKNKFDADDGLLIRQKVDHKQAAKIKKQLQNAWVKEETLPSI